MFSRRVKLRDHLQKARDCLPSRADVPRSTQLQELTKQKGAHVCPCGKAFVQASSRTRHAKTCSTATAAAANTSTLVAASTAPSDGTAAAAAGVTLRSFGQEDVSYVTPEAMRGFVLAREKGLAGLVEHIHFNSQHPENHNLLVVNRNKGNPRTLSVFVDGKWRTQMTTAVVDDMRVKLVSQVQDFLEDHLSLFPTDMTYTAEYWRGLEVGAERAKHDAARRAIVNAIMDG